MTGITFTLMKTRCWPASRSAAIFQRGGIIGGSRTAYQQQQQQQRSLFVRRLQQPQLYRYSHHTAAAAGAALSSNRNIPAGGGNNNLMLQQQQQQQSHFPLIGQSRSFFSAPTPSTQMPIKTIDVPGMGDSITEGTVVDLPVAPGEFVQVDDVVVVLETDKVSVDVRAPEAGAVVELLHEVDDVVNVGSPLFRLDTDADAPEESKEIKVDKTDVQVPEQPEETIPEQKEPPVVPSPEEFVTPSTPPPPPPPATPTPATAQPQPPASSSPAAPSQQPPPPAAPPAAPEAPAGQAVFLGVRGERRTKMSRMRQRVAERMKDAQNTAAMLTTFQECDMGALMEMRKRYGDAFQEKHGVKLGFMSAFVKACTAALQEVPLVNAYMDAAAKEIVHREYVDVSVAVASPTGLVVPVLRNTESMSFADVERNIAYYGQKARDGTLSLDDMAGGTFTISNGGVFGSLMGTPILNPPQSAILGMHATKLRAVVDPESGDVVARPMMYLALTYDHRLIDGREGVTFLKSVANKISDPARLLLEL